MVFRSLIFDFVFLHETKQGGLSKTGETDVSNPDHACPEWDRTLEWDSKRRPERNEPRVDVFPFEFRHKLCLFHSSSLSLCSYSHSFFFTVKNGHAAGKCENSHFETRIGIYFRGDVNILLFFPSPPPLILFEFVRYAWFAIRFSQKFCMERCCKIKSYISVCSCKKDSNWFDLKFRILTSLILAFFFMRKRKNILMFYYKTIFIVHYNTILITVICS